MQKPIHYCKNLVVPQHIARICTMSMGSDDVQTVEESASSRMHYLFFLPCLGIFPFPSSVQFLTTATHKPHLCSTSVSGEAYYIRLDVISTLMVTTLLPYETQRAQPIPVVLDDHNWKDWKSLVECALDYRTLGDITYDGGKADPYPIDAPANATADKKAEVKDAQVMWRDRDAAARNQLLPYLSPKIRAKVRSASTAAQLWSKLLDEFESRD